MQFWRIIFEHIIQIAIFFYLQYIWKQCVCVPIFCLQIYYEKERLTSPISKIFGTRLKCVLVVDRETKLQLITNYQKLFDGKLGFAFLFQITFTRGHNFTKYVLQTEKINSEFRFGIQTELMFELTCGQKHWISKSHIFVNLFEYSRLVVSNNRVQLYIHGHVSPLYTVYSKLLMYAV